MKKTCYFPILLFASVVLVLGCNKHNSPPENPDITGPPLMGFVYVNSNGEPLIPYPTGDTSDEAIIKRIQELKAEIYLEINYKDRVIESWANDYHSNFFGINDTLDLHTFLIGFSTNSYQLEATDTVTVLFSKNSVLPPDTIRYTPFTFLRIYPMEETYIDASFITFNSDTLVLNSEFNTQPIGSVLGYPVWLINYETHKKF